MTNTTDTPNYSVVMDTSVADAIDYSFGPMDGLIAVAQVNRDLPLFHKPARSRWWHRLIAGHTRLYKGCFAWADVGFTYVQVGDCLHILEVWHYADSDLANEVDAVLPDPDAASLIEACDQGEGVSIVTG